MNLNHYIELLYKKLSGNIGPEETESLNQWLDDSAENRAVANEVETSWKLSAAFERKNPIGAIDLDKEYQRLEGMLPETENTVPKPIRSAGNFWLKIAAGLALLIGAFFFIKNNQSIEPAFVVVKTRTSEQKQIVLPDGSEIALNENSTIRYPEVFNQKERLVQLNGEAFFKVTKNPEQAFHVNSPRGKVSVLGTSFNVQDIDGTENMAVQVVSGKVKFQPLYSNESVILQKAEKAFYDKSQDKIFKEKDNFMNEISWHSRKLFFNGEPLEEAILDIEKFYGVKIVVSENTMLNCSYTATFKDKKLADVFETFKEIFGFKIVANGAENYSMEGGLCPRLN